MGAFIKFTLAAACAVLVVYAGVCVWSGRWLSTITVRNDIEDADCSLAFSDGWTWNIALKAGEQKHWLFLLGKPGEVIATCQMEKRTIVVPHRFCATSDSDNTVVISDRAPADAGETGESVVDAFCIVS